MSPLKLLSLNCEGHRHLEERIFPLIEREQPDVLQLQEIFAVDIPLIQRQTGLQVVQFVPMCNVITTSRHISHAWGAWGVCQFSKIPVTSIDHFTYFDANHDSTILPVFLEGDNPNSMHRVVAVMTVQHEGENFTLATTHLTWTTQGISTPDQLRDVMALLQGLDTYEDMILTGDFNAPRGNESFARLAEHFIDWIPPQYTTSIDAQWHKAGAIELMVDGLFSSPQYQCQQVRLVDGVSDHMAIVAEVTHRSV